MLDMDIWPELRPPGREVTRRLKNVLRRYRSSSGDVQGGHGAHRSRIRWRFCRSWRFARRILATISGAPTETNPDDSAANSVTSATGRLTRFSVTTSTGAIRTPSERRVSTGRTTEE